jgi:penicillin-binding protein 2
MLLTLAVVVFFIARLMQIQIVDAEVYRQILNGRRVSTQTIKAVRGEIVDKDGNPLAANRMGYDVIIDQAFFPASKETQQRNEIILKLINLFEDLDEEWIDSLPITRQAPFSFESGADDEIARLRKLVNAADYATAEDTMYWLVDRYKLEDFSLMDARKIAGVRYDMEQRGFSMSTPYTFATDIRIDSVIQVKEHSYEFLGVDVIESAIRYNPVGDLAPHIIGTIGPMYAEEYQELKDKGYALNDLIGKNGAEGELESYLRGTDGKREIYTYSYGDLIEATETVTPIPGNTVSLTIDSALQRTAQEALEAQIDYLQDTAPAGQGKEADSGAVVMLDVKTGKMLAAATFPSYDLTTYKQEYKTISQDPLAPLVNRALSGQYAPGSTFKPTVALAGLRSHVIDEGSTVMCGGTYTFYQDYRPKCLDVHGHISINRALSYSCNIFFYDVGRRTGIETIELTAKELGLGEYTGLEIAEARGQRSTPEVKKEQRGEEWFAGDTLQSSIGQLLNLYTPVQLANYAATIANRGDRMKLTIINDIREYSTGRVLQTFPPEVAAHMDIEPEAFEIVVRGMVAASRTGSARGTFSNYPVDVASKTGTPETSTELPNSTFICFAPADDPEVAIAVVIEKGWHGYTGAPVAKALFDEYFGYDVRAGVNSGPQRLKDERAAQAKALEQAAQDADVSETGDDSSGESEA